MKITIIAVGTQGSIQPHVALGLGLQANGHEVRIATNENFEQFVHNAGVRDFVPVADDSREWMAEVARVRASKENPAKVIIRQWKPLLEATLSNFTNKCLQASVGSDAIISSWTGYCVGQPIAHKLGIPHCSAFAQPQHATRAFPNMLWPLAPDWLGKGREYYNLFSHKLSLGTLYWLFRGTLNRNIYKILGTFPAYGSWDHLVLYGYSPAFLPKPRDWKSHVYITGYWFLPSSNDWQPPTELVDFLQAGSPPVYVGFGSVSGRKPELITNMVVEVLLRLKQRAILATGWGGLSHRDLPESIFQIEAAPHDWLFPRVATAIHHGGPGTTAAALRAGIPSIIIPFLADQLFWSRQISAQGLGPRFISEKRLSIKTLSAAIADSLQNPRIRNRAMEVGKSISQENGISRAVDIFNKVIGSSKRDC
jgi:sterol 3beta-glucosyltransferase